MSTKTILAVALPTPTTGGGTRGSTTPGAQKVRPRPDRGWLSLAAAALAGAILVFPLLSPSTGLGYTVTTLLDSGAGSLRDAIASGDQDIFFSVTGTITLAGEISVFNRGFNLIGPGASQLTISGGSLNRIFRLNRFNITVIGLTLANGAAGPGDGGAMLIDGQGILSIQNCKLTGNTAGGHGGAIAVTAPSASGAAVTLYQTTVSGNTAGGSGGGVYVNGGFRLEVFLGTISGNTAGGNGGGVSSDNELGVYSCTISGNQADQHGGGIYTVGTSRRSAYTSTISGNSAKLNGGGMYSTGTGFAPSFEHLTFAGNAADSDNNGTGTGGGVFTPNSLFPFINCIFSGNTAFLHPDYSGPMGSSSDYNLLKDPTGCSIPAGATHFITGQSAQLAPLANNGGLTWTHALLPGSPALEAGSDRDAAGSDQRGFPRAADADCDGTATPDLGAYEAPQNVAGLSHPPPTILSATADCHSGKIVVTFSGPVALSTAQTWGNYSLFPVGVLPNNSAYGVNKSTVVLDTTGLNVGTTYILTVQNIQHVCGTTTGSDSLNNVACPSEIRGIKFLDDSPMNGLYDVGETLLPNWPIQLDGGAQTALTDANGAYYFVVTPGAHMVSEVPQANWTQTSTPVTYNENVLPVQLLPGRNFGNKPTAVIHSLCVALGPPIYDAPLQSPCCDQFITYPITYRNSGTVTEFDATRRVSLLFSPTTLSYDSASRPPVSATGNPLRWTVPSLVPGAMETIFAKLKVVCPAGNSTPFVTATASISLAPTPVLPCKIVYPLSVQVACSFDPNDKQVSPRGCGFEGLILGEELLTYSIQFQNLGSGPAQRVIIRDTLDPSLDLSTLQLESSSHAYLFALNGRELVWTFPNIRLPAASVDEPGSHGYVRFQIRPHAGAAVGTAIFNTAGIYFDLNPPVFTATTYNTITDDSQPVAAFARSQPDPNNDALVNFAYTGGTAGAQFRWDFGAGAQPPTSTAANPTGISYAMPGLKQAVLQVTLGGCVAEPVVQVFRVGRPVLRARPDGTQVILEWTGEGFALQETGALTEPVAWQNSALAVTSQTVNGEVRQQASADASGVGIGKFFRLAE